jgi:hypothetical protein
MQDLAERRPMPLRVQVHPPLTLEVGRIGEHSYRVTLEPQAAAALAHQLLTGVMAVERGAKEVQGELEAIPGKGLPPC